MSAVTTGTGIDLRPARISRRTVTDQVARWDTKGEAVAALAAQRGDGFNRTRDVEAHPTVAGRYSRLWVLGRPDHYAGVTYLMTRIGAWLPGRLTDATPCYHEPACRPTDPDHAVLWLPLDRAPEPATFEHVTRTVADSANQVERYKTKSNGSCGRWVRTDDSVAVCTCAWKWHATTRAEARAAAAYHRAHPDASTPADNA